MRRGISGFDMRENAERFEGLAETYALHRPGYPDRMFTDLVQACHAEKRIAVDVGAGTGNSTRGLRRALAPNWLVIAAEPGRDMRRVLARDFAQDAGVQVVDACAEAIPLPDASAGIVMACTAFHWFDRAAFFSEAARVLAPHGLMAVVRNRRQPSGVVADFDAYIAEHSVEVTDYKARERSKEPSVRELAALPDFMAAKSHTYTWSETRDCRGLIDLYLTRSTVWGIVRRRGLGTVMQDLQAICDRHDQCDVPITWETTVKWVQRRG